jgi:hypothetical protein
VVQGFKDLYKELGVPGVAWVHGNTKTIHAHGLFPNSDGRRTLNLSPELLRKLQGFKWTKALAPGRGKGRRKALPVYTKAKNLAVRDLAAQLIGTDGSIPNQQWEQLLASGIVTAPRRRKDGSLISFEFAKRRVRASTLEGFVRDLASTNNHNMNTQKHMITLVKPDAPLPPAVAQQVQDAGCAPEGFQALLNEFNRSQSAHAATRDRQPKPQNQQPPTR